MSASIPTNAAIEAPKVVPPVLKDDKQDTYLRANLAVGFARALTNGRVYEESLDAALGAIAASGATGVTLIPLHLRPGAREWFMAWLGREHPELVPWYRELYRRGEGWKIANALWRLR